MNCEVLPETPVSDPMLQFPFGPRTFLGHAQIWGKRKASTVQVQQSYDRDQVSRPKIPRGPLGDAFQIFGVSREVYWYHTNRVRESRIKNEDKARSV